LTWKRWLVEYTFAYLNLHNNNNKSYRGGSTVWPHNPDDIANRTVFIVPAEATPRPARGGPRAARPDAARPRRVVSRSAVVIVVVVVVRARVRARKRFSSHENHANQSVGGDHQAGPWRRGRSRPSRSRPGPNGIAVHPVADHLVAAGLRGRAPAARVVGRRRHRVQVRRARHHRLRLRVRHVRRGQRAGVRVRHRRRWRRRRRRRRRLARRLGAETAAHAQHQRVAHQAPVVILGQVLGTTVQTRLVSSSRMGFPPPIRPLVHVLVDDVV